MATNSTTYYNLPVFAATDQPKWLVDWNTSMSIIDGAIAQAKAAGDNAQTTADANALAITGLSESVSTISTALGTLTTNVTTLTGNVQRINELIGNGTPTTQDKTIIGAINELKAAIDALAPGGEVSAAEVSYNNTSSGLVADDVQDAIDELNTKIEAIQPGGGGADLNFVNAEDGVVTAGTGVTIDSDYQVVKGLFNADSSIGKIYGGLQCSFSAGFMTAGEHVLATIAFTNLPTIASAYDIILGFQNLINNGSALGSLVQMILRFNTDKTVSIIAKRLGSAAGTGTEMVVNLTPCILILKDLGD